MPALRFSVIPNDVLAPSQAAVSAHIDGHPVWPLDGAPQAFLEIFVDDLLAFLTEEGRFLLTPPKRGHESDDQGNLAAATAGQIPRPPLYLVPNGDLVTVRNDRQSWELSREEARQALVDLGDQISAQLQPLEAHQAVRRRWDSVRQRPPFLA
jgi:hypothetical protein